METPDEWMDRAIQEQQRLGIQVVRIKRDAGRHLKCAFPLCDEFPRRGSPGILLGVLPQLPRPRMTEVGIESAAKRRCERPGCNTIPKWRNECSAMDGRSGGRTN